MDEVGRGTTVRDGLAIAFATVHHLSLHNKCRTLFATHFHELADMFGYPNHQAQGPHRHVRFFCTDVHEADVSNIIFTTPKSEPQLYAEYPLRIFIQTTTRRKS